MSKKNKLFDSTIHDFEDRKLHIEKSLKNRKSNKRLLEYMGTYLLDAKDIPSGRKVEYTYYRDERDYSNYADSKAILVPIEEREDLHIGCNSHVLIKGHIELKNSLLKLDKMTASEKRLLLKIGLKEQHNESSSLREDMIALYEIITDSLEDERDKEIVFLLAQGYNETQIGKIMKIARQNVNKRIKKICHGKI